MNARRETPAWMGRVLLAAGLYNVLWGAAAVLFPNLAFDLMGMARPNYPQLWQCIGMIVGVYGVGYMIAATNPARHWPVVLVGLMGKVLGPVGIGWALWQGSLPGVFAWTCVFNDLIWWIPFALVLRHAWDAFRMEGEAADGLDPETALREARVQDGSTVHQLSQDQPRMLVFLRHSGCTFCRKTLAELRDRRGEIEGRGVGLVLVHMTTPEAFFEFAGRYGLQDLPAVADPQRRLYRGIGLGRGTMWQLFGPPLWWPGLRSILAGHRVGRLEGDGTQMPGVFVVSRGRVIQRFLHRHSADPVPYEELCRVGM